MARSTPVIDSLHEKRPTIPFLPGVEGLRGLALLAVLLYHNGFTWARGGFLGVSTFFTLSGFLITLLLIWEFSSGGLDQPPGLLESPLPPADAGVAALPARRRRCSGTSSPRPGSSPRCGATCWPRWPTSPTGASSRRASPTPSSSAAPSPVLHFWSLAIEEQFYLVFPVIVVVTFKVFKGSRRAVAVVLALLLAGLAGVDVLVLYSPGQDVSRVYYGTGTRALELLLGALLALAAGPPHRVRAADAPLGLGDRRLRRRRS